MCKLTGSLEEFCLSPEWTLAPFWPVIDKEIEEAGARVHTKGISVAHLFLGHRV